MTTNLARGAALTCIAGAVLVVLADGPATAAHGYLMNEHPLRGDFPTATEKAEVTPTNDAKATEARAAPRQRGEPGGWLRGDFPMAAESQPEPELVVTRGLGETWNCSVDQASVKNLNIGTTQAVLRVMYSTE